MGSTFVDDLLFDTDIMGNCMFAERSWYSFLDIGVNTSLVVDGLFCPKGISFAFLL